MTPREIIDAVAGVTVVVLVIAVLMYRGLYLSADQALQVMQASIKLQNATAASELKSLTTERDSKQAQLDQAAKDQEQNDAKAKTEIARLGDQLRTQPVRVRIVPASGSSCGGTTGQATSTADPGATSPTEATGVLPPAAAGRFASAVEEIETLSAAYSSCRATLIKN